MSAIGAIESDFERFLPRLQTVHENRIYSLRITCGENYPEQPPTVQFVSRVNLPFVSQVDGKVDPTKLAVLSHWSRNYSIETVLVEIRRCAPADASSRGSPSDC